MNKNTPYLTFNDAFEKAGIDISRVLLIRHKSIPMNDVVIKTYTACQGERVGIGKNKNGYDYRQYDYWAVFIGGKENLAKFYKLYKVVGCTTRTLDMKPENYPLNDFDEEHFSRNNKPCFYMLEECEELSEYNNRLLCEWTSGARNWVVSAKGRANKIISIQNNAKIPFPGYENIILNFEELSEMIDDNDSYSDWHTALSCVAGVYLILDTKTKKQYIGSAYGKDGILGRWTDYANTKDGGNKLLKEVMEENPDAYKHFQYSILRILPPNITDKEAIDIETSFKKKLGTRAFGLNSN